MLNNLSITLIALAVVVASCVSAAVVAMFCIELVKRDIRARLTNLYAETDSLRGELGGERKRIDRLVYNKVVEEVDDEPLTLGVDWAKSESDMTSVEAWAIHHSGEWHKVAPLDRIKVTTSGFCRVEPHIISPVAGVTTTANSNGGYTVYDRCEGRLIDPDERSTDELKNDVVAAARIVARMVRDWHVANNQPQPANLLTLERTLTRLDGRPS